MVDLYYLGQIFETFADREEADNYIELLCMAEEGYQRKDFKISPALRVV